MADMSPPAPSGSCALDDDATIQWLRHGKRISVAAAVAGTVAVVVPLFLPDAYVGLVLSVAGAFTLAYGAVNGFVWTWRERALKHSRWRDAHVEFSNTISRVGHRKTLADVTFDDGAHMTFRLGDSTTWGALSALSNSTRAWVATSPSGTVIAVPGPGAAALAQPERARTEPSDT